jgi:hypothetical protein
MITQKENEKMVTETEKDFWGWEVCQRRTGSKWGHCFGTKAEAEAAAAADAANRSLTPVMHWTGAILDTEPWYVYRLNSAVTSYRRSSNPEALLKEFLGTLYRQEGDGDFVLLQNGNKEVMRTSDVEDVLKWIASAYNFFIGWGFSTGGNWGR